MKKTLFLSLALCIASIAQAVQAPTTLSVTATAGGLSRAIKTSGGSLSTLTTLTISGTIDARDFKCMRDSMPALSVLNMTSASIAAYTGTDGTISTSSNEYYVDEFPPYAFSTPAGVGKASLTSVTLPSNIVVVDDYAFKACTGISSIVIPNSVTRVGYGAGHTFEGCTALSSIILPTSLEFISPFTFSGCTSLTSLNIPSSVYELKDYAFSGWTSFTSLTLPSSLSGISNYAFSGCMSLISLDIPSSVTYIGGGAFSGCTALTAIQMNSSTPPATPPNGAAFTGFDQTKCTLYLPDGNTYLAPESDIAWREFGFIKTGNIPTSVVNGETSKMKVSVQQNGIQVSNVIFGEIVRVYTAKGQLIKQQKAISEIVSIPLLAHGAYVVKVGTQTFKIIN